MNPIQPPYETLPERRPNLGLSEPLRPSEDIIEYLREYTREKPEVVALWCFGIGFVLGWRLKPW